MVFAAMGQSFFTLSLGIGAMAIFGSYFPREHTLTGESIRICVLDTTVAFLSGLVIFPACFAFNVNPGEGPGIVFVTLPNIFNQMAGGMFFGALFFLFMSFAALSTVIAVFENMISFFIDLFGWSRRKSILVNLVLILVPVSYTHLVRWDTLALGSERLAESFTQRYITNQRTVRKYRRF